MTRGVCSRVVDLNTFKYPRRRRWARNVRCIPAAEILECRRLLTIPGNVGTISSFAGVGFQLNEVSVLPSYAGNNPSEYAAQINWGDGSGEIAGTLQVVTASPQYLRIVGSHVYSKAGQYSISVHLTGNGTDSTATTATASVVSLPSSLSSPINKPANEGTPYSGGEDPPPLGNVGTIASYTGVGFRLNEISVLPSYADSDPSHYVAQVNWGDGQTWSTATAQLVTSSPNYVRITGTHVYKQAGQYPIIIYLTGPDGTTTSAETATASVSDMPSSLSQPITQPADRGTPDSGGEDPPSLGNVGTVASYAGVGFRLNEVSVLPSYADSNPAHYDAQINWGDGNTWDSATMQLVTSSPNFVRIVASHVYTSPGNYPIVIYLTGPDGTTTSAKTATAAVSSMPSPLSEPIALPADLGVPDSGGEDPPALGSVGTISSYSGVGFRLNEVSVLPSYADNNPAHYKAQINWGDGTTWDTATMQLVTSSPSFVRIIATHVYEQAGDYPIVVYLTGPDGATISNKTATASVSDMPSPLSQPIQLPADQGTPYSGGEDPPSLGSVGTFAAQSSVAFSDQLLSVLPSYADATPAHYKAEINWGDDGEWTTATTQLANTSPAYVEILGSHTYDQAGDYPIVVYLTGPDGTTASAETVTAAVRQNPDSATLNSPDVTDSNVTSEVPYRFSLVFQSQGGQIDGSTIASATVQVTPPNGESITASLVSTSPSGGQSASQITANYQIDPPNGNWSEAPRGTYTVSLGGSPVKDKSGGEVPGGDVGTFSVTVAVKLVAEVASEDLTVPSDGTIKVHVEEDGTSSSPESGANGQASIRLDGKIVANVTLRDGTADATIPAPASPGNIT